MTYVTPANGHVIKSNETGKYVARSGSERSYTRRLEEARIFKSREEAKAECCGNERIIRLDRLLG